uniref:CUB domain-containing protein n=1 Tax=Capra hircus TaxID=9925 RepID=A0A8C2RLQ5_CAPHI
MHRLILVYMLVCANFCSYRDTSATPQSASIKALRNANLRRDETRLPAPPFWLRVGLPAQQEETYHSECSDNAVFPNCLLLESNHLTDLYRRDETIQVTGHGHVQSPRFPNSYPRNLLLTWRLHSQEKTRIQLAFDNQFGLEEAENDICRKISNLQQPQRPTGSQSQALSQGYPITLHQ